MTPKKEQQLKISESEWPAIAARREQGEAVAAIARIYGCSPALIYGILKRHKPSPSEAIDGAASRSVANGSAAEPEAVRPGLGTPASEPPASGASNDEAEMQLAAAPKQQTRPLASDTPRREGGFPYHRTALAEPIALTAEFDMELRSEVDAAIAAFEGAFDAALGDRRSENLELLRRAASDLTRAGARTTIVLERLMSAAVKGPAARRRPESSDLMRGGPSSQKQSALKPTAADDGLELSPGTVKWFSPAKAFGFIQMDADGGDVFVHVQALERSGLATLEPGQRVRVTTRPGPKGPQAERLELF
jgi:cold shock CspA family protein/transposase-like protein